MVTQRVAASTFAAKYASKKECFNFLSVDVGAYLCDPDTLTVYFLKQLIAGRKKRKEYTDSTNTYTYRCEVQQGLLPLLSLIQRPESQ